jgi:WD40-like Beta Propeller Repeat
LRRSLEKDRKRRLPDIAAARIETDDALNDKEAVAQPAATDRKTVRNRERAAWVAAVLLAAAVTAGVSIGISYVRAPADVAEMRLDIVTPGASESLSFAISPDGQRLVFVASVDGQRRLWLRPLNAETAQPFWSQRIGHPVCMC